MCQKIEQGLIEKVLGVLRGAFDGAEVVVDDRDMVHLGVEVVWEGFEGVGVLARHRMVMAVLKELLGSEELHSVKIKTKVRNDE